MTGYADALARSRRMQAFYEPAYFGGSASAYGDPYVAQFGKTYASGSPPPTTMGGFAMGSIPQVGELAPEMQAQLDALPPYMQSQFEDLYRQRFGAQPEMVQAERVRRAFDAPPVGVANLQNYGVGQLNRYGTGALQAYQPLAREEDLRWRTR